MIIKKYMIIPFEKIKLFGIYMKKYLIDSTETLIEIGRNGLRVRTCEVRTCRVRTCEVRTCRVRKYIGRERTWYRLRGPDSKILGLKTWNSEVPNLKKFKSWHPEIRKKEFPDPERINFEILSLKTPDPDDLKRSFPTPLLLVNNWINRQKNKKYSKTMSFRGDKNSYT